MLYLHDVWVNWFDGEEKGYNVCPFFEWRKEDRVELLDQVPLVKVEHLLYDYMENQLQEIPAQLLDKIYQKAYLRQDYGRVPIDYCFVVTDGMGILAVDTIGYPVPIRKSRLIPRQEQAISEMITNEKTFLKGWSSSYIEQSNHILSPSVDVMIGLTRRERQLKQLMFMALDQLREIGNDAEIRYWYTEWSPHLYEEIQQYPLGKLWENLYKEVQIGWSRKHEQFCENLVKGQPFFELLWEQEQLEKVGRD